jgi:hypothetical protein
MKTIKSYGYLSLVKDDSSNYSVLNGDQISSGLSITHAKNLFFALRQLTRDKKIGRGNKN